MRRTRSPLLYTDSPGLQYRAAFWPSPEAVIKPPTSRPEIEAELARIKASRAAQRAHAVSSSTAELNEGRAAVAAATAVDEGSMEDKRAPTPREVRRERGLENGVLAGGGLWGGGKEKWV
jgi:hypothetical protein